MEQKRFYILIAVALLLTVLGVVLVILDNKDFGLIVGLAGITFISILFGRSL